MNIATKLYAFGQKFESSVKSVEADLKVVAPTVVRCTADVAQSATFFARRNPKATAIGVASAIVGLFS